MRLCTCPRGNGWRHLAGSQVSHCSSSVWGWHNIPKPLSYVLCYFKSEEYLEAVKKTPFMTLEDLQEFTLQYGDVYFHPVSRKHTFSYWVVAIIILKYLLILLFSVLEHLSLCQAGCRRLFAAGGQCDDGEGEERHGSGQVREQADINADATIHVYELNTFCTVSLSKSIIIWTAGMKREQQSV